MQESSNIDTADAPTVRRYDTSQVSMAAIDWVLDHAPVPAALAGTLLAVARFADDDGRGSAQPVSVIAHCCGKSADQTRRDLAALRQLGLLVPSGQSAVEHLPAGQRPTVYDLPVHISGVKPGRPPRHRQERIAPPGARRRPIPTAVRAQVYARDGDSCVVCGSGEDLTLDHVIPWCLGGPDTADNLRVLCRSCNSRKGAKVDGVVSG